MTRTRNLCMNKNPPIRIAYGFVYVLIILCLSVSPGEKKYLRPDEYPRATPTVGRMASLGV